MPKSSTHCRLLCPRTLLLSINKLNQITCFNVINTTIMPTSNNCLLLDSFKIRSFALIEFVLRLARLVLPISRAQFSRICGSMYIRAFCERKTITDRRNPMRNPQRDRRTGRLQLLSSLITLKIRKLSQRR